MGLNRLLLLIGGLNILFLRIYRFENLKILIWIVHCRLLSGFSIRNGRLIMRKLQPDYMRVVFGTLFRF